MFLENVGMRESSPHKRGLGSRIPVFDQINKSLTCSSLDLIPTQWDSNPFFCPA